MSAPSNEGKPVVLITGCSSGLGYALARRLIDSGQYRVVVTGRAKSIDTLKSHFEDGPSVMVRELDVLDDKNIPRLIGEICDQWLRIDVLVNNAGICFRSVIEHMDVESEMLQLKTNYLGPMSLIRAVLPIMREQGCGQIVNVSSVSGMISMPTMASYSASKHALEGATEALWYEARPYGIKVTLVEPGFINSESFRKVVLSKKATLSSQLKGPHSEYYDSMAPFIERLMSWSHATPEGVAAKIEGVMKKSNPPLRLRATADAHIFALIRKVLPARLFHRLMFNFLPGSHHWGFNLFRIRARSRVSLRSAE